MMMAHYVLAILVLLYSLSAAAAADASAPSGDWKPVDLREPLVTDIGKFSVIEYNTQNKADLYFRKVTKGVYKDEYYSPYSNATVYKLVLVVDVNASTDPKLAVYQTTVFRRQWDHFLKLVSFVKISK